jgi:hypothetical protein
LSILKDLPIRARSLNQILHLGAMAMAPAFRVEAIRRYAMKRAAPLSIRTDYPRLEPKHFDHARLFANREDLISSMQSVVGGVIAEVGVARGDFSVYLLNELRPKKFVAIDIFTLHEQHLVGAGLQSSKYLDNMTHLDYYKKRFAERGDQMVSKLGDRTFVFVNILINFSILSTSMQVILMRTLSGMRGSSRCPRLINI